jgi:alanine dehydrogenase
VISPAHIVAELGEVLAGRAGGRMDADEITLFKSLGLAVEDAAAARLLHHRAAADPNLPVARLAPRSARGPA